MLKWIFAILIIIYDIIALTDNTYSILSTTIIILLNIILFFLIINIIIKLKLKIYNNKNIFDLSNDILYINSKINEYIKNNKYMKDKKFLIYNIKKKLIIKKRKELSINMRYNLSGIDIIITKAIIKKELNNIDYNLKNYINHLDYKINQLNLNNYC